MSWIREEDMRAIRQQADIVDVISHYLSLNKKGKNYVAVCPFHDDHDPSLSISTDKQIFKCFVCGAGGDVFGFVQKIENISFPEAVVKVAEMIGYPLRVDLQVEKNVPEEQPYFDLMESYIRFCAYELQSEEGFVCQEYLQKRQINEDIRNRFQIGYAPAQERSLNFFRAKRYSEEYLKDTGLIQEGMHGITASFHDRLMIPIHDDQGHPVGFTARRLLEEESSPKYINTSSTKIYEKGNLIFNYHRAKNFARKNNRVILVEGAMDVLAFEKADIHESIACLGTACTKAQLLLIKALRVPVIVCYDGDRAGQEATYKFSKLALEHNLDIQIVKAFSNQDPDEIFMASGQQGLLDLIRKTQSLAEFYLDFLSKHYDLDNYEDKKRFASEMQNCIQKTCNEFERNTYYTKIRTMTGFDLDIKQDAPKAGPTKRMQTAAIYVEQPKQGRFQAERACLNMILLSKDAAMRFKEEIGFFKEDLCNRLSYYCYDLYRKKNRFDFDELIAMIDEEDLRNFLLSMRQDPYRMKQFDERYFTDSMDKIKECTLQDQIDQINRQILETPEGQAKIDLALKKRELIIQKNNLRRKDG